MQSAMQVDYRAMFYTAPCLTLPKTRSTTRSCYTGVDLANKKGADLQGMNSEKHLIFVCFVLSVEEFYYKNGSCGNLPHFKFQLKQPRLLYPQSRALWQLLLIYCCAILSASGGGAILNMGELRKGRGRCWAHKPYPRFGTDATCQLQTFMLDF